LFDVCSNRGRWGSDDELGTLNYITAEKRLEALSLVTVGRVVSIGKDVDVVRSLKNPEPAVHRMLYVAHADPFGSADVIEIAPHGLSVTHMDALGHANFKGAMYNGRRADEEVLPSGLRFGSMLAGKDGVVTRGVLLDVAASRNVGWLTVDEGVWPEDLDAAERLAGTRVSRGDAVFVRVGLGAREAAEGPEDPDRRAGLMAECMPWLHDREVAVYAGDCIERIPPVYESLPGPLHQIGLVAMGLSLLDNIELEELTGTCRELGRSEFLVAYAPLRIPGGTGSPVNPLCIF
jgi:kynurenine formamidase